MLFRQHRLAVIDQTPAYNILRERLVINKGCITARWPAMTRVPNLTYIVRNVGIVLPGVGDKGQK